MQALHILREPQTIAQARLVRDLRRVDVDLDDYEFFPVENVRCGDVLYARRADGATLEFYRDGSTIRMTSAFRRVTDHDVDVAYDRALGLAKARKAGR